MNCRTTLGLEQIQKNIRIQNKYYVILTNEQSVLTKIMTSFEGEKMQIQYNVLGCRIVLCLHEYKLAIEIH